jgi:hypothetical protein
MLPIVTKILLALIASLAGGWMIFDGLHVLLRGKYFGPDKPGPWSIPFSRLGIDPFSLGPLFILFGALWLLFLIATLCGQTWGWYGALATAIASAWYFPLGTFLSLLYVTLLYFGNVRPSALP